MSNEFKLVPVEKLKEWKATINTISLQTAFDIADDIAQYSYAPSVQGGPDVSALVEALEWYSEQVLGCRKITSEGEQHRSALDRDGGARARAALAAHSEQGGGQ